MTRFGMKHLSKEAIALVDGRWRMGTLQNYERNRQIAQLSLTPMTLQQIGDRFDLSRERVRQILNWWERRAKVANIKPPYPDRYPLDQISLSVRALHALQYLMDDQAFQTVGDFRRRESEAARLLLRIPNCGARTVREICVALRKKP
jgi:tRNA(Ile)-lysidine synthase TilS/MesJ